MMFTHRASFFATGAVVLLALSGCSAGGSDGSTTETGSGSGSADSGSAGDSCLVDRVWNLDTNDLAAQLAANFTSNGLTVTQSTADGTQTIEFSSNGTASAAVDVTYTLAIDSGDGIVITVVQTHSGAPRGEWSRAADPNTLTFSNWDNAGYSVQNTVLVNGTAGDFPITIPEDTLGSSDMEIVCDGNTLSTHVAPSPFTQRWTAEG